MTATLGREVGGPGAESPQRTAASFPTVDDEEVVKDLLQSQDLINRCTSEQNSRSLFGTCIHMLKNREN